jgi:3-phosphoglycerate kinase
MESYFTLETLALQNTTVLLRVDFNVPIENGLVQDTTKIESSLPTIQDLLARHCTIIIATHLGRPNGRIVPELQLNPISKILQKYLPDTKVLKVNDCIGKDIQKIISAVAKTNTQIFAQGKKSKPTLILLENLRFYKEEEENDTAFAHSLASLAQTYVNNAFGVAHRKHASLHAITQFLPSATGFLFETEILNLTMALEPKRPNIWVIGGAKLDKIDLFKAALLIADKVLVGGAVCFSFLKAKGFAIGHSKVTSTSIEAAKKILLLQNSSKLVFPIDFRKSTSISNRKSILITESADIGLDEMGLDLGPKTMKLFTHHLLYAQTIFWNGPLGYVELPQFAKSTRKLIEILDKSSAITICGGGETKKSITKSGLNPKITHISTGGGATLYFLSHKTLPTIDALKKSYILFSKKIENK